MNGLISFAMIAAALGTIIMRATGGSDDMAMPQNVEVPSAEALALAEVQEKLPTHCVPGQMAQTQTERCWARVMAAVDGDTVKIVHVNRSDADQPHLARWEGEIIRVRFWGIDPPEMRQPSGEKSRSILNRIFPNYHKALIQKVDTDQYGRWVAILSTGVETPSANA